MALRDNSILNDIKQMLGIDAEYDVYDMDILTHINGAMFELFQLGVGPQDQAFEVEGTRETWGELIPQGAPNLMAVKNFIYMRTKLDFDPPTNSFGIDAMKRRIEELTWRLQVQHDPAPPRQLALIEEE